jgi:hypothetical protein
MLVTNPYKATNLMMNNLMFGGGPNLSMGFEINPPPL